MIGQENLRRSVKMGIFSRKPSQIEQQKWVAASQRTLPRFVRLAQSRKVAFSDGRFVDLEDSEQRLLGSGASRDFGPAKTSWRIDDPQAAKQKCLISSRFPSLTRVPLSASAAERRLLSADAPEPGRQWERVI
jgi:hypothetical protein